jgi:hypothetical protein
MFQLVGGMVKVPDKNERSYINSSGIEIDIQSRSSTAANADVKARVQTGSEQHLFICCCRPASGLRGACQILYLLSSLCCPGTSRTRQRRLVFHFQFHHYHHHHHHDM